MNFVTLYLADENQVNETKNPITNHVKTEGRTIGDKAHQELYKEKEEIKARKEKEKEESKRAREKKQETKGRTKNKKKQQAKKKDCKGSTISKARNDGGKQREKQRKAEWRKAVPSKTTTKSLWTKI